MPFIALLAIGLIPIEPLRPDTPPPVPVSALASLRTMEDVISVTLLEDGSPAPMDMRLPELLNRRHTLEFMYSNYPRELHDSVTMNAPIAWVLVDSQGKVKAARLLTTTSARALDSLSMRTLQIARFKPAVVSGEPVGAWIPLPARVPPYGELSYVLFGNKSAAPFVTPYTVAPVLLNRDQAEAAILRVIDQVNRAWSDTNERFARLRHLGGTAIVWAYLDAKGFVRKTVIKQATGNPELDSSAHEIVRKMRFAPAKHENEAVDVWIEIPIKFGEASR